MTRRRRSPTIRRAAKSIALPTGKSLASSMSVIGAAIALALAYNFLSHSKDGAAAFGGLTAVINWLDDPTKSIPYRS